MNSESSCHHCGASLQAEANYCRACGAPRARVPAEPPPTPAAATQSPRPWLAVAAGISSLLLVAATIVTLVLTTGGGASVHSATVVTVTTAGEAAAPSLQAQASQATHLSSPPVTTAASSASAPPSFVAYHGRRIAAEVPAGWTIVENEAHKTGYIESKWQSAANAHDTVLIDFSPATDLTLEEDAAPVHKDLQAAAGYQEIYYGVGDLTGSASWMWLFRISGDERVNYFFNRCALGFGVLGSTRSSRFARMRATFRAVAQSVQAGC